MSPAAFKASSCFISIPLVTVAWLLVGYTIAFSDDSAGGLDDSAGGLVGSLKHIGMLGINPGTARGPVPELLFAIFQPGFAIVTAALVSGDDCGPCQVRRLDGLRPGVDDHGVCGGGPLGVGSGRLAVRVWRAGLRRRQGRRNRLRHVGACSGSGARPPHRFQEGRHAPAQPAFRAARSRPAVVRLVRVPRHDGLARGRADPRRQADDLRCRLGSGRRPGRDHPFVRNCEHPWRCGRRAGGGHRLFIRGWAKFRFGYDDSLDVVGVHFVGGSSVCC